MIDIALALILLHGPDGSELHVNPSGIVSLRPARDEPSNKLFVEKARCMVNLIDGKYVAVIEPCEIVRQLMEGK